jgi:hypothetical protein
VFASITLIATMGVAPIYLASGEAAGGSAIAADLEAGFPLTSLWATYGITDRIDAGVRVGSTLFETNELGLIVRAELLRRERLTVAARIWGGWAYSKDPLSGQLLAADGPWDVGALLVLGSRAQRGRLGLNLALGVRMAIRPFVLCYSCENGPDLVAGKGVGWRFPILIGLELPLWAALALHVEAGVELRVNYPDGATPVAPFPVFDGGVTWHW